MMNFQKVADAVGETVHRQFDAVRKTLSDFSRALVSIDDRLKAVEARQPERGEKGESGPQGGRGADGATGARGEDGRPGEKGERGEPGIQGERGEPGAKGDPGRDADPIDISDAVRELVRCPEIVPIFALHAAEAVAKHFETNPVQHGRDGRDGKDGRDGADGKNGETGRDGERGERGADGKSVTIEDVSVFLDAAVAKHVLELERRCFDAVAKAVDKIPVPKDGKDGVDLTELGIAFSGDRTVTVKGRTGEITKRLDVPLWRGYWSPTVVVEKSDIYTHNGTAYIAIVDNAKCEPGVGKYDHEWKVFARKGRDGERGPAGKNAQSTVKL